MNEQCVKMESTKVGYFGNTRNELEAQLLDIFMLDL